MIVLDGSSFGPETAEGDPVWGLKVTCGFSTIRGLVVANFPGVGLLLEQEGHNVIEGNFLGTDAKGSVSQGNGLRSPWEESALKLMYSSDNLIGGAAPEARNLISGNEVGVHIEYGARNRLQGNFIGTDTTGRQALHNVGRAGVWINGGWSSTDNVVGGAQSGEGNLISANRNHNSVTSWDKGDGIYVENGGGTVIQGNRIGTDVTGTVKLGNYNGVNVYEFLEGLAPGKNGAQIGGPGLGEGNLISGNDYMGLLLVGSATKVVQGNLIGTDVDGSEPLGNVHGISVASYAETGCLIGGTVAGAGNVVSGNNYSGITLQVSTHNIVQGNLIGTDRTGTHKLGNEYAGLIIYGASKNLIGGTTPAERNVISGNGLGVDLRGSENKLQGNFIGTDVRGTGVLGNGTGIFISDGPANNNEIGGVGPGAGNLISGNGGYGGYDGAILMNGQGVNGTRVRGNLIGTDVSGKLALGNVQGIRIGKGSADIIIGGTEPGAGNVIAATEIGGGISLGGATQTRVKGNFIGTDVTGTIHLGNALGIQIDNGNGNLIGGAEPGARNVIAHNFGVGVLVRSWESEITGIENAIRGNSIFDNEGLGIDLGNWDDVTLNDPLDADFGANNLQNFPVISSASALVGSTKIEGTLNSTANTIFTLDFYANAAADPSGYGEGEIYLGAATVTTDGNGDATFSVTVPTATTPGQIITATATDPAGNTSEFSGQSPPVRCAALTFAGFLPPIGGADASGGSFGNPLRTFKNGSTIPVKFTISCDGVPVLTGIHRLQAVKYSDATTGVAPIDATPQDAATTGNQFRLADSQWHFNLDTKAAGTTAGIWQLVAILSDGSQHTAWIQLK